MRSCCGSVSTSAPPCSAIDALVEEQHLVGDVAGEADLVGHDHQRPALLGQVADDREHLADQLGVEGGRRLVEQHHLRAAGPAPGRCRRAAAGRRRAGRGRRPRGRRARPARAARGRPPSPRRRRGPAPGPGPRAGSRSTVLCGNRWWDWKTMPLRARSAATSRGGCAGRRGRRSRRGLGDPDHAGVGGLEHVERAQHGRLARAGRPEQRGRRAPAASRSTPLSTSLSPKALRSPRTSISVTLSCEPLQPGLQSSLAERDQDSTRPSSRARRRRRAAGTARSRTPRSWPPGAARAPAPPRPARCP